MRSPFMSCSSALQQCEALCDTGAEAVTNPEPKRDVSSAGALGWPYLMPGWRNWQTQRTQNPPDFGPWGFDPPSRHHLHKQTEKKEGGWFRPLETRLLFSANSSSPQLACFCAAFSRC